jgi:GDP-4-dehydro-6-deoxy-D-mannose reductase
VATALLLDALRERDRPVRVVLAGSAAELGPVDEADLPVNEEHPSRPVDPYGLSKWMATTAALAARGPLEVMVGRIFNPIGPGTPGNQALGRFAARFADPAPGTLSVGNLDTRRDFIDVRDAARALIALARHGRPGRVYHVGTGRSQSVRDGLERLLALSGSRVRVEYDPGLSSRKGPQDSRADIRRIVADTGWAPAVSWEQSLKDLWLEARREAARGVNPCA